MALVQLIELELLKSIFSKVSCISVDRESSKPLRAGLHRVIALVISVKSFSVGIVGLVCSKGEHSG